MRHFANYSVQRKQKKWKSETRNRLSISTFLTIRSQIRSTDRSQCACFLSLLFFSFLLQASVSYRIVSYHNISYIISHHFISYHILSYPLSSFDLLRLVSSLLVWSGLVSSILVISYPPTISNLDISPYNSDPLLPPRIRRTHFYFFFNRINYGIWGTSLTQDPIFLWWFSKPFESVRKIPQSEQCSWELRILSCCIPNSNFKLKSTNIRQKIIFRLEIN